VDDPPLWRALWQARASEFLAHTEGLVAAWSAEADRAEVRPRTRARLEQVTAATEGQRRCVADFFARLGADATQLIPTRPEPGDSPVLHCYENLFRDWVWGSAEAERALELVARLAPGPLGRLAVYGAGAGRLAFDVHQALQPSVTLALDTNPLPLLVAAELVQGETIELPEFPVAPHSETEVVVWQTLSSSSSSRRPAEVRDGFGFVFADARQPPFAPASLDTVLTSWFIDVVDADLEETAASIRRVLRQGGVWLNLGPLRFKRDLPHQYAIEEIWEIVGDQGFELVSRERADVPYFDSPVSGSRRTETVFGFAARRTDGPAESQRDGSPAAARSRSQVPEWITDPRRPIPVRPSLMALGRKSMFTAGAISLVDGQRSLLDVASEIGRATGVDPGALLDQLRAFFGMLPPE
jgi:SAM-dependent methyltransferase